MEKEVSKRGLHVVTISFNGPAQDPARRKEVLDNAKVAMTFLKKFGAERLVVFSPARQFGADSGRFQNHVRVLQPIGGNGGRNGLHGGSSQPHGSDGAERRRARPLHAR